MTTALARAEQKDLDRLEQVIAGGLQHFYDVGCALTEIRDRRLYRATHGNFHDYCSDRWQIGRRYADRMVQASAVVNNLRTVGLNPPATERQARALAPLEPDLQRLVWSQVLAETDDTAAVMAGRVEELARIALAALPPEQRQAIIEDEEQRAIDDMDRDDSLSRFAKALKLLAKLQKLLTSLGLGKRDLAPLERVRVSLEQRADG